MNYRLYAKANNLFLHNEFLKLLNPAWVDKQNLIQRNTIQQFFYEKIKAANIAQLVGTIPEYSDSEISKKFWTEITEKLAQSFVRTFTDDPTQIYDYVRQLRDIIHSGKDGYITIKGQIGGSSRFINQQLLAENKILGSKEGLKLYISHEEAQKLWNDIWLTLNFKSDHDGKMAPEGYNLNIEPMLPDLQNKIVYMYDRFYNLFSQGESEEFTIFFTTLKGKGISQDNKFSRTYGKILGFTKNSISFKIEETQKFQEYVASMIFYLLFVPNAFVVVKDRYSPYSPNAKIFFTADIFGLYPHEYLGLSKYDEKDKYHGQSAWSQAEFALWQEQFKNIFKPEDIRMFIAFKNKEDKPMLDFLMNWYNRFLKQYKLSGVNLDEFDHITDLRK